MGHAPYPTQVCVCGGGGGSWVNAVKQGHTHEISQETEDIQETADYARFARGCRMMKMM